jgi:hypothetical protein
MNKLAAMLVREGLGRVAGNQIRKSLRKLVAIIVYYAIMAVLALAALAFLYVLIYAWLAQAIDPESAAAILVGANLLAIGLMLIARAALRRRRPHAPLIVNAPIADPAMQAGIALGQNIGRKLRQVTPQIVIAAAVIGLIIGARPGVLRLFRRSPARQNSPGTGRKGR